MRELTPAMHERQKKLVAASVKGSPIWTGHLELQLSENEVINMPATLTAHICFQLYFVLSHIPLWPRFLVPFF